MKALVAQDLTGTPGLTYSDVTDVDSDVDVVIDVGAAGVCFPDLLYIRGEYQHKMDPPFIPGMEVAGVVRSAPTGSGYSVGQRVSAFTTFGGYSEQVAVAPEQLVPIPDDLDDAEAVCLLANYYTMYFALVQRGALQQGETVLVLGSAGGVGTAAVQVAKALGARVIAMVHRAHAVDYVKSLGADVVVPLSDNWPKVVKEHTRGQGVDIVVDPVGGPVFDDAIRTLGRDGRLLVIGFAAGAIPTVKVNRLLLRNIGVLGVSFGDYITHSPAVRATVAAGVNRLVAAGLRPPPPVRFPLSDGRAALEALAAGKVLGKVVLEP